jgi:hypothetical protein
MLFEAEEELFVDIRNKLLLGLFRYLLVLRRHHHLILGLCVMFVECLKYVLLALRLVTNKWQRHNEGAGHQNHCAQINI